MASSRSFAGQSLRKLLSTDGHSLTPNNRLESSSILCLSMTIRVGPDCGNRGIVCVSYLITMCVRLKLVDSVSKYLLTCLENFADTIVGSLGVKHRKRTTIRVKLAAKVNALKPYF